MLERARIPAPFSRLFRIPISLVPMLLAGCAQTALLQHSAGVVSGSVTDVACVARASGPDESAAAKDATGDNADSGDKPPEPEKPPPPRTLGQAIHAYWIALHSHPCSTCKDDDKNGKKPDSAAGEGKNKKETKDPGDNGKSASADAEAPGKKSRPAAASEDKKKETTDNGKSASTGSEAEGKKSPSGVGEEDKKEGEDGGDKDAAKETWYSAHAQATMDTQRHGTFPSQYSGPNSLSPGAEWDTSLTATLFLDARLYQCGGYTADLVFNPELAGGRGFSNVNGLAGFTNGDITRVGLVEPTPYIARLYLRQTLGLGGEQEKAEDEANQLAGDRDIDRVTLIVGKFAFTDVIDNNRYSHDPRTQMMNWSLMYNGAWDYPANVRGYDYGVAIDFNQKYWALRYGIMGEPAEANGAAIDPHIAEAFGQAIEWELRWGLDDHPGKIRLMAYLNRAHMGDYREALEEKPIDPIVIDTRDYRFKYGCGMNFEQEISRNVGVWGRLGWSDGHTESWAFTPIDRTGALGIFLKGTCWARPDDEAGLAGVCNGLSKDHRDYLAAGGLDFSIGDGRLNYGLESIMEFYYRIAVVKGMYLTPDFQEVWDPAYNKDRGPVSVVSLLAHIEY